MTYTVEVKVPEVELNEKSETLLFEATQYISNYLQALIEVGDEADLSECVQLKKEDRLPGVPHKVSILIRDGEHEYTTEQYFLLRPGQDPYDIAESIVAFHEFCVDESDGVFKDCDAWEEPGGYRLAEVYGVNETTSIPDYFDKNWSGNSKQIRWIRALGDTNGCHTDPNKINGPVTFVNAYDPTGLKLYRVYVSTLLNPEERRRYAQSFVWEHDPSKSYQTIFKTRVLTDSHRIKTELREFL